ncbi:MAG: hypothetical protein ACI30B_07675 [Paludibacteraceae bacterium]
MERKIGERFEYNGVMLEVAKESVFDYCQGCYFNDEPFCNRPSGESFCCDNLIFKEVKP